MRFDNGLEYVTRRDKEGKPLSIEERRKIFISYRKKDNLYGIRDRIVEYILAALDCAVWYDVSLTPGNDYDQEISRAIQESDVVVLLLTPQILQSRYVWDIEIRQAVAQKKGIIPVSLGISLSDLQIVEEKLGHIQLVNGDCLMTDDLSIEKRERFVEDLVRSLNLFVISQDIAMSVTRFFASKKHLLPARVLSFEQMYLMAYGLLRGLGTEIFLEDAIGIMDSLLHVYARDEDTCELKGEIAYDLMQYYARVGNADQVLEYGRQAELYGNLSALCYLGTLYDRGEVLQKDEAQAIACFEKGAMAHHLESLRMMGKKLLQSRYINSTFGKAYSGSYENALPYILEAARKGTFDDTLTLLTTYWNCGKTVEEREKACQYLEGSDGSKYRDSRQIAAFLRKNLGQPSYMTTYQTRVYGSVSPEDRLGEILIEGVSFFLYREKVTQNRNDMVLMRGDTKICEFFCSAWGYGDMDFFDLVLTEDGHLMVHSAEFDHYGPETLMRESYIVNPFSDQIVILHVSDGEWLRGMRKLKYPAYDTTGKA